MTRVGILGTGAEAASDVVRDAGAAPVVGEDALSADVDCVAALGEDALLDVVSAARSVPVLPVDAGREYGGISGDALPSALVSLATGEYDIEERRTLSVTGSEVEARALADVLLVTTEPASISEYGIESAAEDVDEVRADGVVAATPAGSHGYAADAGAPLLDRGSDSLAVVPIAPFRIEHVQWVLSPPAAVTVLREESEVGVFVDGRERALASAHEPVTLTWGDPLPIAAVPAAEPAPRFD